MAADLDQAYLRWSREGLSDPIRPEELSVPQMLDHGSISFGRYAVEPLSWEKWSVFSHNKHQEELEKLKSPGLVAKKKAYFEEYYKRIKSLKGLADDDQQTVVTLDYGADSSISSQTGEDDETALQIEAPQKQIGAACSGVCSVETTSEQNSNTALPVRLPDSDPSSRCPEKSNLKNISNDASHVTYLKLDATTPRGEETVRNLGTENLGKNSRDASQVTHTGYDDIVSNIGSPVRDEYNILKNNDIQIVHEIHGCSVHEAIKPFIHNADAKTVSETKKSCLPACESFSSSEVMGTSHLLSEQCLSTPAHDDKLDKFKAPRKKDKELASRPGMKDTGASIGMYIKPGGKNKSDQIQASQTTNYLNQKRMGSKERIANSTNKTDNIAPRSNKLCKSKVDSNVTIPRPFSFSTGKRTVAEKRASSVLKGSESGKINSKATASSTSSVPSKDKLTEQNVSKTRSVGSSKKATNLERNRQQEAFCKKPPAMETNPSKLKEREGSKERPKPWSTNHPPFARPNLSHGSNSGVGLKANQEKKVGNGVSCGSLKPAIPQTPRKPYTSKAVSKQEVSSRTGNQVVNEKKSSHSTHRQEVKGWQ